MGGDDIDVVIIDKNPFEVSTVVTAVYIDGQNIMN